MHQRMLKALSTLLAILLLLPALPALAEEEVSEALSITLPPLTEDGFLLDETEGAEFVHKDAENGEWCYISSTLHIQIKRFQGKVGRNKAVWFVSDIKAKDGLSFRSFLESPDKPGKKARPEYIAQRHQVIYAHNGDLWTWRVEEKRYPGLIIRDGQVIKNKTYNNKKDVVPTLDELALYPDGRFEVNYPGQKDAETYLAEGVRDVFAFGPILIKDGVLDERLSRCFKDMQPRSALGMVAPGHYVGVMVEGRTKRSKYGADLAFVADILHKRGCQLAFNLDGGQTSAMVFMGDLVMREPTYNGYTNTRGQPDIIGIGTSQNVTPRKK